MKYCPICRSQYSDVTLRFCLQDGTVLQEDGKQSTIDTVSFSDPVTADNILRTEELNLYSPPNDQSKAPKWNPAPPKSALRREPEVGKSKSPAKILLAVFSAVLAIAAVGAGSWFYLKNQTNPSLQSMNSPDSATPEIAAQTPPAGNSDSTSRVALANMSQPANSNSESSSTSTSEAAKKEIADAVELWRQSLEARKVPDYLSRYAEKADYFDRSDAGITEIRVAAQKMFDTYSDIDINLTNVRVAVDPEGTRATAVFDKEWSYHAAKDNDLLEGKARTKLRFQKNGKDWKIISEKYQKIYYMEN